jgi:hypothetical protein
VVTAPWIWFVAILAALAFALLAHLVVQRKINTMDFVTALKVQE